MKFIANNGNECNSELGAVITNIRLGLYGAISKLHKGAKFDNNGMPVEITNGKIIGKTTIDTDYEAGKIFVKDGDGNIIASSEIIDIVAHPARRNPDPDSAPMG